MNTKQAIESQYLASLEMMKQTIEKCPQSLWSDPSYKNQFWHITYHALFYTDFYLHPAEDDYLPWPKQKELAQFMGPTPWPPHEVPEIDKPYAQDEMLEYIDYIKGRVREIVPVLDFAGGSGFDWLPMSKLELQFYSIRHLQLHIGELCERLWQQEKIEVNWLGMGS